jgi:hypothetical protein
MNQKQMSTVAPNTLNVGSKTLKLGALALAAALAMTLAPRAYADPAPLPLSRPQLGGEVAVQSVLRYIALHSNDVAGYQAAHASAQRGPSAEEQAIANYLADHAVSAQRGPSAAEQAIDNYLRDHGVKLGR